MYDLNSTIGPIIVEGVAIIAYYILGKIAVDDAILLKPGRFTHDECEEMETHVYRYKLNSPPMHRKASPQIAK